MKPRDLYPLLLCIVSSLVERGARAALPYDPSIEPPPYKSWLQPTPEGYPGESPKTQYRVPPYESHMGPARVYNEEGFSYPGFRTMDNLNRIGHTVLEPINSFPLKREDAFFAGRSTIHPGTNYHVSPVQKASVTWSYHTVDYSSSTQDDPHGDKFDDISAYNYNDQLSTSLYGGTQNAFGSFYASQSNTPSFTCAAWSRSDRPGYNAVQASIMYPVAGLPDLFISGKLNPYKYNSRPDGENTTITWKLIQYHTDDLSTNFTVLNSGNFLVKNVGTEVPIILEGDNEIGTAPNTKGVYVRHFVQGSIALVIRNNYTEEIPSYGHVVICDDITYLMSPIIPYTRASPDLSPLFVDPANGTIYTAVLTPGLANMRGALWHTAKVVVGIGFETTFRYKITEVSQTCKIFQTPSRNCDVRGGDGFAFVIHNSIDGEMSLGTSGGGLGYAGMENALAIEFDTWYNSEDGDPYQNHVSFQTNGEGKVGCHHKYSIGSTNDIPDLADGRMHTVKIKYQPNVDIASYFTRSRIRSATDIWQTPIIANKHTTKYWNKDSSKYRMGQLSIYFDENPQPVMEVPINLAGTLGLDISETYGSEDQMAKAWVGFTASTGVAFQRHEIFDWHYTTTPTTHPQPIRNYHCSNNIFSEADDPTCHPVKLCSVPDRMESEHVGPNDPRNPRGAGHPGHFSSKYAKNCDKFTTPQGNTAPQLDLSVQSGRSDRMPSSGAVEGDKPGD